MCDITIPDKVGEIGYGAFNGCNLLESITYGKGIVNIPAEINRDCSSLKNVTFKGEIKNIASNAFSGCESMEIFNVPSTLKKYPS